MNISHTDLALLSFHWVPLAYSSSVAVLQGNGEPFTRARALEIVDMAWEKIARYCAERGYEKAIVCSDRTKFSIPASFVECSAGGDNDGEVMNETPEETSPTNAETLLYLPEQELKLGDWENATWPIYINSLSTQQKFYANATALNAQGMPPEQFLSMKAYDLNDPDEFGKRCDLIAKGEILRAYSYRAWRWFFDLDAGRFRQKQMDFISHFRRVQFCGVPCWMSQVLEVQSTGVYRG